MAQSESVCDCCTRCICLLSSDGCSSQCARHRHRQPSRSATATAPSLLLQLLSSFTTQLKLSQRLALTQPMDAFLVHLLHPTPAKHLPLPPTQPAPTMLHIIGDAFKSCLPRRVHEPTGPFMVLFDMLLSIFVPQGACKTVIDKLPVQVVGLRSDPNLILAPVSTADKCPICLAPYQDADCVRHLTCNHAFHAEVRHPTILPQTIQIRF